MPEGDKELSATLSHTRPCRQGPHNPDINTLVTQHTRSGCGKFQQCHLIQIFTPIPGGQRGMGPGLIVGSLGAS